MKSHIDDLILLTSIRIHQTAGRLVRPLAIGMGLWAVTDMAMAETVGDMFKHMGDQASPVANGLVKILYVTGFGGAGNGVWKLITRRSRNEGVGEGLQWVAGGAGVMGLGKIIDTVFQSAFQDAGGGPSGLDLLQQ